MKDFIKEIRHHWRGIKLSKSTQGNVISWRYRSVTIASWNLLTNAPEQMIHTPDSVWW